MAVQAALATAAPPQPPQVHAPQVALHDVLREGVAGPDRARSALRDILAQPPLCMSKAEFDVLNITTHSWHGTVPDMIRFLAALGLPAGTTEPQKLTLTP